MEVRGQSKKANLIVKTWERCKSIGRGNNNNNTSIVNALKKKSKSWPRMDIDSCIDSNRKRDSKKCRVAPEGCFSVYVGEEKERFVIRTEYANHPLFKILLDEAESEYGYNSEGPIWLPCKIDFFCKVLMAMDDRERLKGYGIPTSPVSFRVVNTPRNQSFLNVFW